MAVEWMSLLSAAAVILLIIFIIVILLRANNDLARAQEEGEHFVDEWARREEKLEEKRRVRKAREESLRKMEKERQEKADFEADFRGQSREKQAVLSGGSADRRRPLPRLTLVELDQSKRIIRRIPVDHLPFRIGRSSENDLVLDDLYVSRKHVSIERRQDQYIALDQGTKNKIFANGRLHDQVILEAGLHFFIGNVELLVEMKG